MITWTVEEINFISCYWEKGDTSKKLCFKIMEALPFMEPEMRMIGEAVVKKLNRIPEKEYAKMNFFHSDMN